MALIRSLPRGEDSPSAPPVPLGKHCWVVDYPGHPGVWPGLLVEWERDEGGAWRGYVAVVGGSAESPRLAALWIEAAYLRRA